ncbi:vWA domain-containing protein [Schlesneria paludicola]|uniref:vWA domain-containing protein n=1 Tax=Schlesneria paludicola TaxID=360056 RepID=UPI00029B4490|nr:VWA domain-containing protein [Schlesneria paludicola]
MAKASRPGGEMASRPLHFFWILDCSGSMGGARIQELNFAIRECIPAMQEEARQNPECNMLIRVITFSSGARWHTGTPTPIADFKWTDVTADGVTDMGRAMELLADVLTVEAMGDRALPPVLVMLTDGQPTDNFSGGLKKLMDQRWAQKAVRVGIAIGGDGDTNVLEKFINHPEFKPLRADNAPTLAKYIKWASTAVVKSASAPVSEVFGSSKSMSGNVSIPTPPIPVPSAQVDPGDVW